MIPRANVSRRAIVTAGAIVTPRVRTGIRWAIGLVLLGVLVSTLDLAALGARLGTLNFGIAVPAILGLVAVHLVAATSWRRLTWHLAGVRLDWRTTIRLYYAGQALGTVTPANLGADVYRVMATDGGPGRIRMARPVVIQRLMSIVALLLLGVVGALVVPIHGLGLFVAALLIADGRPINLDPLVPPPDRALIESAAERCRQAGQIGLSPIKNELPEHISYGAIRLVLAAKEKQQS